MGWLDPPLYMQLASSGRLLMFPAIRAIVWWRWVAAVSKANYPTTWCGRWLFNWTPWFCWQCSICFCCAQLLIALVHKTNIVTTSSPTHPPGLFCSEALILYWWLTLQSVTWSKTHQLRQAHLIFDNVAWLVGVLTLLLAGAAQELWR